MKNITKTNEYLKKSLKELEIGNWSNPLKGNNPSVVYYVMEVFRYRKWRKYIWKKKKIKLSNNKLSYFQKRTLFYYFVSCIKIPKI